MAIAAATRADIGYIVESVYGTTPGSPALKKIRRTNCTIGLAKDSYNSEELRSDRMMADMRHGMRRVKGDIETELSLISSSDFLEAVQGGTWTAGVTASQADHTNIITGANSFTVGSGSLITKGFRVGDRVLLGGMPDAGNNKKVTIIGLTATVATTLETLIVNASPDTTFTIATVGYKVLNGNTYRSFTIERAFADIAQFAVYKGCRFNSCALSLPATGLVKANYSVIGQDAAALAGTTIDSDSTYTAAATNSPLAAVSGLLLENGVQMATVTGFDFTLDNGMDGKAVVGSNIVPDVLWGNHMNVSGNMSVLFDNATMFNKFVNETESSILVRLDDPNGTDWMQFYFPRIKYSDGKINDNEDHGISISMPFTALAPSASNADASLVVIQRSTST